MRRLLLGSLSLAMLATRASHRAPRPTGEPEVAEIRVRFTRNGGAPAVGVPVTVKAIDAVRTPGWRDLEEITDGEGRVVFSFEPPAACSLRLEAKEAGYARVRFLWPEIPAGSMRDLGEVALVRGGAIGGRVLDAAGRVVPAGWVVSAELVDAPAGAASPGREKMSEQARPADDTGVYRIGDLAPGRYRVWAEPAPGTRTPERQVDVRAGETADAELRVAGAPEASRIAVEMKGRFAGLLPEPQRVVATSDEGAPRAGRADIGQPALVTFDDVPPGEYRLAIDDPRFQPWARERVRPGDRVQAEVVGNSGLRLEVRDSASSEPIRDVAVRIRYSTPTASRPDGFPLLEPSDAPAPGGLLEGLVAGDATLVVSAPGYAPSETPVLALQPREIRTVAVHLAKRVERS